MRLTWRCFCWIELKSKARTKPVYAGRSRPLVACRSLLFAHRLQWFLNSYAASNHQNYRGTLSATVAAGLSPPPTGTHDRLSGFYSERSQLSQAVTAQGRAAAGRFMVDGPGRIRVAPMTGQEKSPAASFTAPRVSASSAAAVQAEAADGSSGGGVGESKAASPELQAEAERPASPTHVMPTAVSDAYAELPGETPPHRASPVLGAVPPAGPATLQLAPKPKYDASRQWYNANLMFWDEFLRLSRTLRGAPEGGRNDMLRDGMRSIAEGYLGGAHRTAATLYVPVGDPHNRIVGVHPDDSFCFKTKERVPIMVVLEVVMQDAGVWGDTKRAALRARRGGSALVAHMAQEERAAAAAGRMQREEYSEAAAQRRARKAAAAAQRSGTDAQPGDATGHRAHGAARHAAYTWGLGDSESSSGDEGGAGGARPRQASGTAVAEIFADARKGINEFGRAASAAFGEMRRRGSDMFHRMGGADEEKGGGRKSRRRRGRSTAGSSRSGSRAGLSTAAGGAAGGDYSTLVGSGSDRGGRAVSEGGHVSDVSERGHVEMLETNRGDPGGLVQPLSSSATAPAAAGDAARSGQAAHARARGRGGRGTTALPPRGIKGRQKGTRGGGTATESRPLHTSVGAAVQNLAATATAGAKPSHELGEALLPAATAGPAQAGGSPHPPGTNPPHIHAVAASAPFRAAGDGKSTPVSVRANASRDHVMRYGVHKRDTQHGLGQDMQELDEGDDHSVFSDSGSDGELPSSDGSGEEDGLGMWGTGISPARPKTAPHTVGGGAAAGASYADAARGASRSLRRTATSSEEHSTRNSSTPMLAGGSSVAGVGTAGAGTHVAAGLTDFETAAAGGFSDLDEALATGRHGQVGAAASPQIGPARGRGTSDVGSVVGDGATAAALSAHAETHVATVAFKQRWKDKAERIRAASPFGHLSGWRLVPVIIKSHDDLRQEQFASQLLQQMAAIWKAADVPVWLRPYDILSTDEDGGIIEAVPDTVSLHALKEKDDTFTTLDEWFGRYFHRGRHAEKRDSLARQNFARSLAAYSIACYVLQIKDRHNGNILLDANGHVIHIDFGFLFTSSPGGNMNFESAPWKLTSDFVGVLGGKDSRLFKYYRSLCIRAFSALRKSAAKITLLVEMTLAGNSHLPCFQKGSHAVLTELADRFAPHLKTEADIAAHVNGLVDASASAFSTSMYDAFQYYSLGIR